MIKKLFAAFMCLSIALAAAAQDESKEDIQKRQQQLQREIAELNSTLNQIKSSKKKSLSQLALVQKKIRTRNALINNINKDLRRLDNTIYTSQLDINRMRRELDSLKETCFHVVAYDFGIKRNILRHLVQIGSRVTVVPANTPSEDVLSLKPDGVFLSNGPGDPEPLAHQAAQVKKLVGKAPVFGICLGHQILGLAFGGETFKLKFGHHGANHPVLNRLTGKVEITSQNHGFAVDPDSLRDSEIELTHVNLNDQTVEGFRHRSEPVFCVQYHPEAAPGPHDSHYLFHEFAALMKEHKR